VVPEWWRPPDRCDIAFLRPVTKVPEGVWAFELGTSVGTSGHDFRTHGFEKIPDRETMGSPEKGTIVGHISWNGCRALLLKSGAITYGFSGAPVWDDRRQRIVGMISDALVADKLGKGGDRAVAVTSEELRQACPALQLSDLCPYRALEVFKEEDESFFRGRKRVVDELLATLYRGPAFMAVLGPSGSGKSSVVRAGLIPEIRRNHKWGVIVSQPRTDPFGELAKEGLVGDSKDLIQRVDAWQTNHRDYNRLLIILDQFEQLFIDTPESHRKAFLTALDQLLSQGLAVSVILVMRNDYHGVLTGQEYRKINQYLGSRSVYVSRTLTRDELADIIVEPAHAAGYNIEEN
jgi:hypothetical protein